MFVIDYVGRGVRYTILDLIHREDMSDFKVWSVEYAHMLLKDDYERLLHTAGFRAIEFYGTYQREPYDKATSDWLIIVAQQ